MRQASKLVLALAVKGKKKKEKKEKDREKGEKNGLSLSEQRTVTKPKGRTPGKKPLDMKETIKKKEKREGQTIIFVPDGQKSGGGKGRPGCSSALMLAARTVEEGGRWTPLTSPPRLTRSEKGEGGSVHLNSSGHKEESDINLLKKEEGGCCRINLLPGIMKGGGGGGERGPNSLLLLTA